MSDARALSLDSFQIRFINVNTVRKQRPSVEHPVPAQVLNRRNTGCAPFNASLLQAISKWASTFSHKGPLGFRFGGVHHQWQALVDCQARNHFELGAA